MWLLPTARGESGAAALSGDRRECWNGSVSNDVRAEAMPARMEAAWAVSGALTVALFGSGLRASAGRTDQGIAVSSRPHIAALLLGGQPGSPRCLRQAPP